MVGNRHKTVTWNRVGKLPTYRRPMRITIVHCYHRVGRKAQQRYGGWHGRAPIAICVESHDIGIIRISLSFSLHRFHNRSP